MLERPLIAGSALVGMSSLLLSWSIGSVVNYAAFQRTLGVSIAGREMPRSGSGVARVMAALAGRSGTPLSREPVTRNAWPHQRSIASASNWSPYWL
jgi:hypothetical protein